MDKYESLSHTAWDCKYHVVFIPKCRRQTLYKQLREHLGEVFRKLAAQRNAGLKGHLMPDHVHMMLSIPPKYSVSQVVGFIKGKSAIHLARVYGGESATSWVSTSGREGTSSRRWDATSGDTGSTSKPGGRKTRGWTSSVYGGE